MNNYWVGVTIGAGFSAVFFAILMIMNINQNQELKNQVRAEIKAVEKKVAEHDEIMQAYAFYNWQYTLKMDKEEK